MIKLRRKDMDKLSREEVKELVEKISYGMGSDEEVSEWILESRAWIRHC